MKDENRRNRSLPFLRHDGVEGSNQSRNEVDHNVVWGEVKDFAVGVSVCLQLVLVQEVLIVNGFNIILQCVILCGECFVSIGPLSTLHPLAPELTEIEETLEDRRIHS